jgi:hypothetical protein
MITVSALISMGARGMSPLVQKNLPMMVIIIPLLKTPANGMDILGLKMMIIHFAMII